MMKNVEKFCFPTTVASAVALLKEHSPGALVVAGGTLAVRRQDESVKVLVDISRLPIDHVEVDAKGLRIGARATFDTLSKHLLTRSWAGMLIAEAASQVTSQLIRNASSIGGDVVSAHPYNNMPSVLLALDAEAVVARPGRTEVAPIAEFLGGRYGNLLGRQALLTEIRIPASTRGLSSAFKRFARSQSDWEALAQAVVVLGKKGGRAADVRIALAGVTRKAQRFPEAEKLLGSRPFSEALAVEVSDRIADTLEVLGHHHQEYRRNLARVLVRRAIVESWRKA